MLVSEIFKNFLHKRIICEYIHKNIVFVNQAEKQIWAACFKSGSGQLVKSHE